jgi:hypothetical protein
MPIDYCRQLLCVWITLAVSHHNVTWQVSVHYMISVCYNKLSDHIFSTFSVSVTSLKRLTIINYFHLSFAVMSLIYKYHFVVFTKTCSIYCMHQYPSQNFYTVIHILKHMLCQESIANNTFFPRLASLFTWAPPWWFAGVSQGNVYF